MKRRYTVFFAGLSICLLASAAAAPTGLSDPYEILDRYFRACGGLDRLKAERTQYSEGDITFAGLKGTIKMWVETPDRSRVDTDLGVLNVIQGDDGKMQWTLDTNGKLQKITKFDEPTLKRRDVKRRLALYEYADRNSGTFKISFKGTEKTDTTECYVLQINNTINDDALTYYINTQDFLLEKSVSLEGEYSNDTYYQSYRDADGLKIPYRTRQVFHLTGQEQEVNITKYASNPAIDPALFEPPEEGARDFEFEDGQSAENIPFIFKGNHIYLPVVVDCKERYWILDTGAGMSVIDETYAKELGMELQGDLKGAGAGGTVDVKWAKMPPFALKGIRFNGQTVGVIDMKELNVLLDVEAVGILGFDFLSRFVTKVDFDNEFVSFYSPETFVYSGNGHEIPLNLRNGVFVVDAALDREHSGIWLFDLGAGSVSLDGVYAFRTGISSRKGVEGLGRGAGQTFAVKKVRFKTMDFAGYTVKDPTVSFSYGGTDTVLTSDQLGILGNNLFRNFVIYCDYANERVIVEKGKDFDKQFPEDRSGLMLARSGDGRIEVFYVSMDTPADKAGLVKGDIIRSINGIETGQFGGLASVRDILMSAAGNEYTFVIDRAGKSRKIKIKLADLL